MSTIAKGFIGYLLLMCILSGAHAASYPLPLPTQNQIGSARVTYSQPGETLAQIAAKEHISVQALKNANPFLPKILPAWTRLTLPAMTLPDIERKGIIINRAENLLYYFNEPADELWVFPVAMGRFGWETPLGETSIKEKRKDPVWFVPESIQIAMEEKGVYLPDVMAAGPMNPLGKYALRTGLSKGTILIHGTNKPDSIGRSVSSGCIRMFNEDVEKLFNTVKIGTPVKIIEEINHYQAAENETNLTLAHETKAQHLNTKKVIHHFSHVSLK